METSQRFPADTVSMSLCPPQRLCCASGHCLCFLAQPAAPSGDLCGLGGLGLPLAEWPAWQ